MAALSNFVDGTSKVLSTWLNQVDVFVNTLFNGATTPTQALTALGATTVGQSVLTAINAAAGRTALGSTTVGDALFIASSAANARTTIAAAASGTNTDITSLNAPALGAATATTPATGDRSTLVATTAMFTNEFQSNLATSGYQKLPNGLIRIWGTFTGSGGSASVTYPITFPTAIYHVSCQWHDFNTGPPSSPMYSTSGSRGLSSATFTYGVGASTSVSGTYEMVGK